MYSSDYEKLWFLHKTEGKPKGVSINTFSMRQGIFYCDFNTWFVKARKDIISVQIEGAPSSDSYLEESPLSACNDEILKPTTPQMILSNTLVTIQTCDGPNIRKSNLDYLVLKALVEKLEGLC